VIIEHHKDSEKGARTLSRRRRDEDGWNCREPGNGRGRKVKFRRRADEDVRPMKA